MDRNQRREQERNTNNLNTWYKSLSPTKKNFIEYEIEKKVIENDRITNIILDSCYIASIANNTDLELLDIEKIIAETSTYIEDYKNKLEEHRGDMIKMIKTTETKIKAAMRLLIKAKKDKIGSIKKLEIEYNIPLAELDVMWLSVKQAMGTTKKNVAEQEVKEVMEETKTIKNIVVINKQPQGLKKVMAIKIPYAVTPKEIEEERGLNFEITSNSIKFPTESEMTAELDKSGFEFKSPSKLKVIEEIKKIQGEYGIYIKTIDGVKIDNITYKDIADVKEEKQAVQDELEVQNQELQKELEETNKKIKEVAELKIKENKRHEEIEDVFNMQ